MDWNTLTITLEAGDKKVTIQRDPALTRAEASLKMLAKTWSKDDQGFLVEMRELTLEDEKEEELPPRWSPC